MHYFIVIVTSLFFAYLVVMPSELRAQVKTASEGSVYAAPGMMVKIGRPAIYTVPKPTSIPIISPVILPRFWSKTDSTRKAEYAIFIQELYRQIKYPVSSLREQVEGIVYLNFRVNAAGQIDGVTLKKSNLVLSGWSGEATNVAKDALVVEAMRVVKTLRFPPSTSPTDTVTVPVSYRIQ
ncbi:MAG: hypothetical protein EOO61_10145 [Hymenobacter sp.]|nr:MAG: hypothetical protein EOO61_10145 [Hymenobacter sp.]